MYPKMNLSLDRVSHEYECGTLSRGRVDSLSAFRWQKGNRNTISENRRAVGPASGTPAIKTKREIACHNSQCHDAGLNRMHVVRDAGSCVECNRCPYVLDVLFRDFLAAEEVARGICSIHLETVCVAPVRRYKSNVVEHSASVEKFGVQLEANSVSRINSEILLASLLAGTVMPEMSAA